MRICWRWFTVAVVTLLLSADCGGGGSTKLELEIIQQPSGGSLWSTVTCVFRGRLVDGDERIATTVQWWWESNVHTNQTCISEEQWIFDETNWQPMSACFSVSPGYLPEGYYWVIVTWEDEDGVDREFSSDMAFCSCGM